MLREITLLIPVSSVSGNVERLLTKNCAGVTSKKKKKENLAGSLFKKKIERFGVDIVSTNFPFLTPL